MTPIFSPRRTGRIVAAVAVLGLLTGCGAGQLAPTALGVSSISGLNTQNSDGSVLIRNLAVAYPGVTGYPRGGTAPVEVHLFNQTGEPVTVSIGSKTPDRANDALGTIAARSVTSDGATSASITIGPLGFAALRTADRTALYADGLTDRLDPGEFLNLVFEFSNGSPPLAVPAPVAVPETPAPRAPGENVHTAE